MAIAIDTTSHSNQNSGASLTWAHTVTAGSNMILDVGVKILNSETCSGVTYNGVSLTQVSSKVQGAVTLYLFSLVAPATGAAHNIVASFSGSLGASAGVAA